MSLCDNAEALGLAVGRANHCHQRWRVQASAEPDMEAQGDTGSPGRGTARTKAWRPPSLASREGTVCRDRRNTWQSSQPACTLGTLRRFGGFGGVREGLARGGQSSRGEVLVRAHGLTWQNPTGLACGAGPTPEAGMRDPPCRIQQAQPASQGPSHRSGDSGCPCPGESHTCGPLLLQLLPGASTRVPEHPGGPLPGPLP